MHVHLKKTVACTLLTAMTLPSLSCGRKNDSLGAGDKEGSLASEVIDAVSEAAVVTKEAKKTSAEVSELSVEAITKLLVENSWNKSPDNSTEAIEKYPSTINYTNGGSFTSEAGDSIQVFLDIGEFEVVDKKTLTMTNAADWRIEFEMSIASDGLVLKDPDNVEVKYIAR